MALSVRVRTVTQTVTVANGQTTANGSGNLLDGVIRAININAPVMTGTSFTLTVNGPASGFTLLTKAAIPPNAITNYIADGTGLPAAGIYIDASANITITSNATELAQRVITITYLIER